MTRPAAGPHWSAEVITDPAAADALRPEWEELSADLSGDFMTRPSYALSWWAARGTGALHLVVVRRDGRLAALAPLHRRTVAGRPVLRWLGHGLGTVTGVLARDGEAAARLWGAVAEQGTALQLTHVRPASPALLALRRDPAWAVRVEVDDFCPVVELPPGATAADLRSRDTIRRLRRSAAASAAAGSPISAEVVDDLEGLERRWPDVVRTAALGDAGTGRTDLCAEPWSAFTLPLLREEAAAGRLLLLGLLVGGRWSAHVVALRSGPVVSTWLTRFDPAVAALHPGRRLFCALVERAGASGFTRIDQLIGQSPHKVEWSGDAGYDVATVVALPRAAGSLAVVSTHLAAARAAGDALRALRAARSSSAPSPAGAAGGRA